MKHRMHTAAIVTMLSLIARARIPAEEPIYVGSDKQLFIDELYFAMSKDITLKIQPPRKTGEAILKREHPWESATLNWFTVVQDQGRIDRNAKYRMWYEAYDVDGWPTADDTSFCYAESRNGIHWTKPELGLFPCRGSMRNNMLFRQIGSPNQANHSRVHGTGVYIDANGPAERRYKAVGQGIFGRREKPPHRIAGMYSADGLKWTRLSQPICDVFADSQYSGFWDPSREQYVLYGRNVHDGGSVRIGLLDPDGHPMPGRSVDDCLPIIGDSLSLTVEWASGCDVSAHPNKSARIRVEAAHAELFGFQFVDSNSNSRKP